MKKCFDGVLGLYEISCNFDYDDTVFKIEKNLRYDYDYLHYIGDGKSPVKLPDGCTCCDGMFSNAVIYSERVFDDFDTSSVESMKGMFTGCRFPSQFKFNDLFDTSNVMFMDCMFSNIKLEGSDCTFSLGSGFNTRNVRLMRCIFDGFKMPVGFTFGENFDLSSVEGCEYIFTNIVFPSGFSFRGLDLIGFDSMENLFVDCTFPSGFVFDFELDCNSTDVSGMFNECTFMGDYSFDCNVDIHDYTMYENCKFDNDSGKREKPVSEASTPADMSGMFSSNNFATGKVSEYMKGNGSRVVTGSVSDSMNGDNSGLNSYKKEILGLLKQGKSFDGVKGILSSKIESTLLEKVSSEVRDTLVSSCNSKIRELFDMKQGKSSYNVSDVQSILIKTGYPKDIINECIVGYLGNQYLCE